MTYHNHYIVVEPHGASAGIIIADSDTEAAQKYGCANSLGGKWVAVQRLAGIGSERDAKWSRIGLVGPDCEPMRSAL